MTKLLFLVLGVNVALLNIIVPSVKGEYCDTYEDCPSATKCCRQNECVVCSYPDCTSDSGCFQGQQCCKGSCSYRCAYETCAADGDCTGTGKCCRSNICVTTCREPRARGKCVYDSDCPFSADYCCRNLSGHGKCNLNCLGMPCRNYTDCAKGENCWSNKCAHVIWCNRNTDCPVEQCCTTTSVGGRCEDCNYDYGMPSWKLNVIIFASIFGVIIIMVIVVQSIPCLRKGVDEVNRQWEMSGVRRTGAIGSFPVIP